MRVEYLIYQRLVWDGSFRRDFLRDRAGTLRGAFPGYQDAGLFGDRAVAAGLEEDAYRRIAAIHKTSRELFPKGHALLVSYYGLQYFEDVLARFFELSMRQEGKGKASEILDPFDGYVIGPLFLRCIGDLEDEDASWIRGVLEYEWAVWHAWRVSTGWPPLVVKRPLSDGATLVECGFDLKSLLTELKRLRDASVGGEVVKWRIRPSDGWYAAVIFPQDGDIKEAVLDPQQFANLSGALAKQDFDAVRYVQVAAVGESVQASFLCCSNEGLPCGDSAQELSPVIQPEPH